MRYFKKRIETKPKIILRFCYPKAKGGYLPYCEKNQCPFFRKDDSGNENCLTGKAETKKKVKTEQLTLFS
jgi:hypothetical protein